MNMFNHVLRHISIIIQQSFKRESQESGPVCSHCTVINYSSTRSIVAHDLIDHLHAHSCRNADELVCQLYSSTHMCMQAVMMTRKENWQKKTHSLLHMTAGSL